MAKGKDLAAFGRAHGARDIRSLVAAGLASLGESWEGSAEFAKRCGISFNDLPKAQKLFPEHWVEIKNRAHHPSAAWAGTKQFAARMRKLLEEAS